MEKENLIAYAANFVSFLLDEPLSKKIDRIILFGSVARGDFDEESDIDIFIDTKEDIEKDIDKIVKLFNNSGTKKKWELKGLKNEISVKSGELKKWKLYRDILTDSIILYGKFSEMPENIQYAVLLQFSFKNFKKSQKVMIWRKLYGYTQKVGKKEYKSEGIVEKLGGRRIDTGVILPIKNKKELLDFLNKEKINYIIKEIWIEDFF